MIQIEHSELVTLLSNKQFIIGCDECGYGSLAGTVCVGGVRAPVNWHLDGLNDSKKLSEKKRLIMRDKLLKLISDHEIEWHLAERSNIMIDKHGIAMTLKEAYIENFHKLHLPDCLIVCDGTLNFDHLGVEQYNIVSLIKADQKVSAVMAASILAKTYRDEQMKKLHLLHPQYGWDHNSGYGSKDHLNAIAKFGVSPYHRMSYAPMKNMNHSDPNQLKLFE